MIDESKTIKKTKVDLVYALYEILCEKEKDEKITISVLTEKARISRTTFYSYYDNIEDFSTRVFNFLAELFVKQIIEWLKIKNDGNFESCKTKNLLMKEKDRELFYIFFNGNTNLNEMVPIYKAIHDTMAAEIKKMGFEHIAMKSPERFDFFFRGFVPVAVELLHCYSYKRTKETLSVFFEIIDGFLLGDAEGQNL